MGYVCLCVCVCVTLVLACMLLQKCAVRFLDGSNSVDHIIIEKETMDKI